MDRVMNQPVAWCIVMVTGHLFGRVRDGSPWLPPQHCDVVRFARKEDAEAVMAVSDLFDGCEVRGFCADDIRELSIGWHEARTVGHHMQQLATVPPETPLATCYFVSHGEGTIAKTAGVGMSWENVTPRNRIQTMALDGVKTLVLWCRDLRPDGSSHPALLARLWALYEDWDFESKFNAQATPGSGRREALSRCAVQLLTVMNEAAQAAVLPE